MVLFGANGDAFGGRFEEREREALGGGADVEVDEAGGREVDADAHDLEPEEEILGLEAGEGVDHAAAEVAGDVALVMQLVLELGVAGLVEVDPEGAVLGEGEVADALGEEAHGQAVVGEDLVDGGGIGEVAERGGRRNEREEKEEEGWSEGKHNWWVFGCVICGGFKGVRTLFLGWVGEGGVSEMGFGIGRERERERRKGDSLYTEGIRRRMINYWYSVVTDECCVLCAVWASFSSFFSFLSSSIFKIIILNIIKIRFYLN